MNKSWFFIAFIVLACLVVSAIFIIHWEDAGRKINATIPSGNIEIPHQKVFEYHETSKLRNEIIDHWTNGKLDDWVDGEKVDLKNPRIVLACLTAGKRIEEVNEYLLRQTATGVSGSRWMLNPRGGYNFTDMAMTPVLYLFHNKPELLFPKTREHLLNNILTIDGDAFTRKVPYLYIEDSENHILMTESSRYLKNKWLWEHGATDQKYDNKSNGVEKGLRAFLEEIYEYGIYEFHSDPYLGYTFSALLNLHAFADGEISLLAEKILDRLNWQYALGSYRFKYFPPYRRKFTNDFRTRIDNDYHTAFMKVWASMYADSLNLKIDRGQHHALWAAIMSYRPPDKAIEWALRKPHDYFVIIGHGYKSCPEIYSGGTEYLFSAGGANQGRSSLIVAKPIVLFLNNSASEMKETFYMHGPSKNMTNWNNTGVYKDFAVTKGPVHIPSTNQPILDQKGWKIHQISVKTFLAIYSKTNLGIMAVVNSESAENVVNEILQNNENEQLNTAFNHPNGNHIFYELDAPNDTWIISKVNGMSVHRKFQEWAFFEGDIGIME